MPTYLFKTEPGDYAYDDLVREGKTVWDGVANPQACMVLRRIPKGSQAFIYHTGKEKAVAGLCRVVSEPYPDPKRPESTVAGDVKYPVVDVEPVAGVTDRVTLAQIKGDERFAEFALVRQSRLSVMDVPTKLDRALRTMAGLP